MEERRSSLGNLGVALYNEVPPTRQSLMKEIVQTALFMAGMDVAYILLRVNQGLNTSLEGLPKKGSSVDEHLGPI